MDAASETQETKEKTRPLSICLFEGNAVSEGKCVAPTRHWVFCIDDSILFWTLTIPNGQPSLQAEGFQSHEISDSIPLGNTKLDEESVFDALDELQPSHYQELIDPVFVCTSLKALLGHVPAAVSDSAPFWYQASFVRLVVPPHLSRQRPRSFIANLKIAHDHYQKEESGYSTPAAGILMALVNHYGIATQRPARTRERGCCCCS